MWFQRARTKWLVDGNGNTKYYHNKTINRRRRNRINMLKNDEGQWIEDVYQLQILVKDYFSKLFVAYYQWKEWKHTKVSFPALNDANIQKLKEPLSDEEIKRAVFSMKPWKAPNPDGFLMLFY